MGRHQRISKAGPSTLAATALAAASIVVVSIAPLRAVAEDRDAAVLKKLLGGGVPANPAELKVLEKRVAEVTAKVRPYTVGIDDGSGVVVTKDGYVLTVGHLGVRAGRNVPVVFPNGRRVTAKTLGNDHGVDAGMVKIPGDGPWPHAEMGTSADLKPGQWCLAVGYPVNYRRGQPAMLRLGRVLRHSDNVIITDCKIMGGDSGGPLFDLNGRLIGISSRCDDSVVLNIHVPVDQFRKSWDRLAAGEDFNSQRPSYAFLGVAPIDGNDAALIGRIIPGSAAEKAGLKARDEIVRFDGQGLDLYEELVEKIRKKKPGDKVSVDVRRNGKTQTIEVTLGKRN